MVKVSAYVDGQEIVSSGTIVLSDDYKCSLRVEEFVVEIHFINDSNTEKSRAEVKKLSEKSVRYTLFNWGKEGNTTTGELDRLITVGAFDYNIAFAVSTIKGDLVSRVFSYTIWNAGQTDNG